MLTIEELLKRAPSIGASHPHPSASSRYTQAKTLDLVNALADMGWYPTSAKEQWCRNPEKRGFQRHEVRFRNEEAKSEVGEESFELVMINSHDCTTPWILTIGIFVKICSNGLVVSKNTFEEFRLRHVALSRGELLAYTQLAAAKGKSLLENVGEMKKIQLPHFRRVDFANAALRAKYGDPQMAPIGPETLLIPRRKEDEGISLWKTYQVIQENCVRGLQREPGRRDAFGRSMGPSNPVVSIERAFSLNQSLWDLALGFMN